MSSDFGSDIFNDDRPTLPDDPASSPPEDAPDSKPARPRRRRATKQQTPESDAAAPSDASAPSGTPVPSNRGETESKAADDSTNESVDAPESQAPKKRRRSRRSTTAEDPAEPAAPDDAPSVGGAGETATEESATDEAEDSRESRRRSRRRGSRGRRSSEREATEGNETEDSEARDDTDTADTDTPDTEARESKREPGDHTDDEQEPARRKKRRRRRSRRDSDDDRQEQEVAAAPIRAPAKPSPATRRQWVDQRTRFPTVPGQRAAVFVDLDALLASNSDRSDDIAFTKLRAVLTGKRNPIRTVAYGTAAVSSVLHGPVREAGFDVREVADRAELAVALSVEAMSVGQRVDCVVVAPGAAELSPLSDALRAIGVRVESAGFGDGREKADRAFEGHFMLGEDCMFVP